MRLGVITTGLLLHDFEPGLDLAHKLGFQAIELGCGGFHSKRYADPAALLADPGRFERWRAAFAERSLEISALAIHGAPLSPDPAEAATYEQEFIDACRLAERRGRQPADAARRSPGRGARRPHPFVGDVTVSTLEPRGVAVAVAGSARPVLAREGRDRGGSRLPPVLRDEPERHGVQPASLCCGSGPRSGRSSAATSTPRICSGSRSIRSR